MKKTLKIAVCIPCYGDPRLRFTVSLIRMLNHFHTANFKNADGDQLDRIVEVFWVSTSNLIQSRHQLVADATYWGADYMLWLDADHTFPPDTLARLWTRNLPIVGCNYARRIIPTAPTAAKFLATNEEDDRQALVYTTPEKAAANELEEVAHMGLGVCLMDMRIFDVLQAKSEEQGKRSMLPLFEFCASDDGTSPLGEDVFFFRKCREAGFKIYCDHGASWEIGHIHEAEMSNATACNHKEKWAEKTKEIADRYEAQYQAAVAAAA